MSHVTVTNLSIDFPVYDASAASFRHVLFKRAVGGDFSASGSHMVVSALKDVSFSFGKGDRVALIGRNGGGKSTLLKAMAGVYKPTTGQVEVEGNICPVFNLLLGMEHDATGYENIRSCGLLWGMSRAEIRERIDSISEFSELGEYLNMPVRTYSNGMLARLAFSIATANESGVLLFDEGIGAGDSTFNAKAFARIQHMVEQSSVLFIALHATEVLRRLCNKAVWLHGGKLMGSGDFEDIVKQRAEWEQQILLHECSQQDSSAGAQCE